MDNTIHSRITTIPLSSPSQNELFSALAKAQGTYEIAKFDKVNTYFKNNVQVGHRYASHTALVSASRPSLSSNGISVFHDIIEDSDGRKFLYTKLSHSSGQFEASIVSLNPTKHDTQGYGSEVTYWMRYSYKAITGVCSDDDDDDDGETAVGRGNSQESNMTHARSSSGVISPEQVKTLQDIVNSLPQGDELIAKIFAFRKIVNLSQLSQDHYQNTFEYLRKAVR